MSDVVVRAVGPADCDALFDLIAALADYERLPPPEPAARQRLRADILANPPRFSALLAELDGRPVGYAIYFFTYSTFLARPTLYLEDIFVLPDVRGRGIGTGLMRACAKAAVAAGCGRLEWQVLRWNDLALDFYRGRGAQPLHEEWICYRLEGEPLARLSEEA